MTIANVLNELLEDAGVSESALGRETGIPRATINRIVSGKTPDPRASTLNSIAEYFSISVDQLLGKSPLNKSGNQYVKTSKAFLPLIPWEDIEHWDNATQPTKQSKDLEYVHTELEIDSKMFALKIQGDSMWPQFPENTTLIIDSKKNAKNRDFVIVRTKKDNSILFRQLILEGNYKFIKPLNTVFPTLQICENDTIIGVVIQTINNFT